MSEVSESLHFWRMTANEVKALALASGVMGRLVASNEDWTTFVPIEDDEVLGLALASPTLCLRWVYYADFGLGLTFHEAGAELGAEELGWRDAPVVPARPDVVEGLRSRGVVDSFEPLEQMARSVVAGVCAPRALRDQAATLLRLPAYEWLSPAYCRDTPIEELQGRYPDAEDVGEDD